MADLAGDGGGVGAGVGMAEPVKSHPAPESAPLRWGIVGTGKIAADFAAALSALPGPARLVAVASRRAESAAAFGVPRGVSPSMCIAGGAGALAELSGVDAAYVATPNDCHAADAAALLRGGGGVAAVLVEKPFAVNAGEARGVVEAARRSVRVSAGGEGGSEKVARPRFCMEAMWTKHFPAVKHLRKLIEEGAIGDIVSVEASFGFAYDDEDWVGRLDELGVGGGALLDIGVYPISFCSMIAGGGDGTAPDSIAATGTLRASGVDDANRVELTYGDIKCVALTSCVEELSNTAVVSGTKGKLTIPQFFWAPDSIEVSFTDERGSETLRFPLPERSDAATALGEENFVNTRGMTYQALELEACAAQGMAESPVVSLAESVAVMLILDTVRQQIGVVFPQDSADAKE